MFVGMLCIVHLSDLLQCRRELATVPECQASATAAALAAVEQQRLREQVGALALRSS